MLRKFSFVLCSTIILILTGSICFAEEQKLNYNEYYQFPFSMAAEYQVVSPFSAYGSDFNIFEASADFRFPLPGLPSVQPVLQLGIGQYDSRNYLGDGDKWDFSQIFGGFGAAYVHRFSSDFEVGLGLTGGYSQAFFSGLTADKTYTMPYLYAEVFGSLALDPSYSMSIEVKPRLKYQAAIPPEGVVLADFDGLSAGIGVSVHYRFGEDPDSAASLIRSLRFGDIKMPAVFAAMQSYYVKNPAGAVSITNKEDQALTDLEISFFQPGLMDAPSFCFAVDELAPGESVQVPVLASFNENVFQAEGITPYTGELIAAYEYKSRFVEQRQTLSFDLHDKTALTWDDERKVAAFITPADSALRNYTSHIRQTVKDEILPGYNKQLQEAVNIFNALSVIGCIYQSDPSSPFTSVQNNDEIVDSVSLPRDTLKRIAGDCDDLTVLYCSLLETVGIETAYITVPGHIYAAFNTKLPSSKYLELHPSRDLMINLDGEIWIPVEITLIGVSTFNEAWKKGAGEWYAWDKEPEKRGFTRTHEAQAVFRPVGLKESDLGLQYGSSSELRTAVNDDLESIMNESLSFYEERAKSRGKKQDYNRLGVAYSRFSDYTAAERAFNKAVSQDRGYIPALVNLANIETLRGSEENSLSIYYNLLEQLEKTGKAETSLFGKILLNVARLEYNAGNVKDAGERFAEAKTLAPDESLAFSYIAGSEEGVRASQADYSTNLLFVEEEE
jgi:tetratricopeptide (TPR) repeat protein